MTIERTLAWLKQHFDYPEISYPATQTIDGDPSENQTITAEWEEEW